MGPVPRFVALDIAHHVTQRGNARRFILESDAERGVYLDFLQQGIHRHGVELIGYCLMSKGVHLVDVPRNKDGLARPNSTLLARPWWSRPSSGPGHPLPLITRPVPTVPWLIMEGWRTRWSDATWRAYLQSKQPESSQKAIRDSTFSGRPLGSAEFTRMLERQEHRPLTRQKPDSKKRIQVDQQEAVLSFDSFSFPKAI